MIEFGSGRGLMSYWMAKASQLEAGQKFILVDKASHRHKYDNKLKDDTSHDIARIRADIQDLILDQIPQIKESSVSVLFSHIFAIKCNFLPQNNENHYLAPPSFFFKKLCVMGFKVCFKIEKIDSFSPAVKNH